MRVQSKSECVELLRKSVEQHNNYTKECMRGEGFDRHLMGLKVAAIESGGELPAFFKDPVYSRGVSFRLSTSQVIGPFHCAFGPVVPNGYGICYNVRDDDIVFVASSFNDCPDTSTPQLCEKIRESCADLMTLLTTTNSKL